MKFTCSTTIQLPRSKVVELWDNFDNLKHWQDGYQSHEHLSGTPGKEGAKSKMIYAYRGKPMILEETILENSLPERFAGQYDHKHMTNTMVNTFTEHDGQTTWTADIEYVKIKAFLPRLMFKLFPGMARKQTQKWLDQFKNWAESQEAS